MIGVSGVIFFYQQFRPNHTISHTAFAYSPKIRWINPETVWKRYEFLFLSSTFPIIISYMLPQMMLAAVHD